MKYNINKN